MPLDIEAHYRQYGSMVHRRCRELLGDETEAIDATQEVFVSLMELGDVDVQSPSSLLYVMATRQCLNRLRAKARRPEVGDDDLVTQLARLPDLDQRFSAGALLRRLFDRAPVSSRVIAVLHHVDGLTLEETADEVGMSVSGVRRRLRLLRKQLQQMEATLS